MKEARGAAASCAESSAIFDWALARRISAWRQIVGGARQHVERDQGELPRLLRIRAGIDPECARIAIGSVERVDRIGKAARLADVLEEARRHAPSHGAGEDLHGVVSLVEVGDAAEAEHHMRLLGAAVLAHLAAEIARLGLDGRRLLREAREEALDLVGEALMLDLSGRRDDRMRGFVVACEEPAHGIAIERGDAVGSAEDGAPDRLLRDRRPR